MKKVRIKTMRLSFFKGVRAMSVDFEGQDKVVKGPNGSGKSTIADAFTWLLWGKNAAGDSDTKFLIKTADEEGNEIPHVNHEVEAVLDIDGQETTMKRVLVPDYDKEDRLKGNHTEYYFNEVPLKKAEYDEKVRAIIAEDVFKLITSPYAFLQMGWKEQREMLMQMAGGDIKNEDIASESAEFHTLLEKLTGKTLEEYKRELDSKIKRINETMLGIPARIDEQQRSKPESEDIVKLKELLDKQKKDLENYIEEKTMNEKSISSANQGRISLAKEIADLKFKLQQAINDEEAKQRTAIHLENVKYDRAIEECNNLKRESRTIIENGTYAVKRIEGEIKYAQMQIESREKEIIELRNKWHEVNSMQYQEEDKLTCPVFGTTCHDCDACAKFEQKRDNARNAFIENKRKNLCTIQERGKGFKAELEILKKRVLELTENIEQAKSAYEIKSRSNEGRIVQLEDFINANQRKPLIANINIEDYPAIVEIKNYIASKEMEIESMEEVKMDDKIIADIQSTQLMIETTQRKIADAERAIATDQRIMELEVLLKDLGRQKAELEMEKKTATDFEIAKMNEIGKRVNGLFKIVTWQLFTKQVNGEDIPTCIALINGVRWTDANTAARINAGIDVASTLSTRYNASAPMFIDNAECSGYIYNPGTSQRILLEFDRTTKSIEIHNA